MTIKTISLQVLLLSGVAAHAASPANLVQINLGSSASFGVLGGSGVTNASGGTLITGNVGSSPTPSVVGLLANQVLGTLYLNPDPVTAQAQVDLTIAYTQAATAPCGSDLTGQDLGGKTLIPGVYCFSSSTLLTGTLTLDAQGSTNAQWIFQTGTALTTATNSTVALINGAQKCNVYWQVGSSATIQTGNAFVGNILALSSITLDGGTLNGRALASNGAVSIAGQETIDNSPCTTCNIFVSSPSTGTVAKFVVPVPFNGVGAVQSSVATALTSAESLVCYDKYVYIAQSGVYGGPRRIVRMDRTGLNMKNIVNFTKYPSLASSGGPEGPSIQPGNDELFFSTTTSNGFANSGAWGMNTVVPAQAMLPLYPNGGSNGGGATAFLVNGPYAGSFLVLDTANQKVVRIAPPFSAPQTGVDFITANLVAPTGMAVSSAGNVFVSNGDGTIEQFGSDGTYLGQFAVTGLHNKNISFDKLNLVVVTTEGPIVWIRPNGTQSIIGTVVGASGVTVCPY